MTLHNDLERLATRGTERGADSVYAGAIAAANRPETPAGVQEDGGGRSRKPAVGAAAIAAAAALIAGVGLVALDDSGESQLATSIERDSTTSAAPALVESPDSPGQVTELDYGDGVLQVPHPPVQGLAEPRLSTVVGAAVAATLGEDEHTTVRFDLPAEGLTGAVVGSVVVTVLPNALVDASGGEGADGVERARSTAAVDEQQVREFDVAGTPALLIAPLDVNPGSGIGRQDRVSSQLIWTQTDGSVAQLISDLMTEAELINYAQSIIETGFDDSARTPG